MNYWHRRSSPALRVGSHFRADRLVDLENLRAHYVLTLNEWLRRFEKHAPKIAKMYDERFVRMWRLYLYGSSAAFNYSQNELTQIVFTKGIDYDYPLTREFLGGLVPSLGQLDIGEESTSAQENVAEEAGDLAFPNVPLPPAKWRFDPEITWFASLPVAEWCIRW